MAPSSQLGAKVVGIRSGANRRPAGAAGRPPGKRTAGPYCLRLVTTQVGTSDPPCPRALLIALGVGRSTDTAGLGTCATRLVITLRSELQRWTSVSNVVARTPASAASTLVSTLPEMRFLVSRRTGEQRCRAIGLEARPGIRRAPGAHQLRSMPTTFNPPVSFRRYTVTVLASAQISAVK